MSEKVMENVDEMLLLKLQHLLPENQLSLTKTQSLVH